MDSLESERADEDRTMVKAPELPNPQKEMIYVKIDHSPRTPTTSDRECADTRPKPAVSHTPKVPASPMTASRTLPLLICGIGNPGSTYANTLHSAGHTVVNRLADQLGYANFHKERELGNGLVSKPPTTGGGGDWTLWQSTSYMNESGKGVRDAFQTWSKNTPLGQGRLVVVYDELEKPLGVVTVRTAQGASPKGHNGLKSILSVIGNTPFSRIGIGIGRPVSRDSDDVARYVLKKMTTTEKLKIDGCVEEVIAKLKQLERG